MGRNNRFGLFSFSPAHPPRDVGLDIGPRRPSSPFPQSSLPLARAALYLCSKKVLVHLNIPPEQREGLTNFYTGKLAFIPIMKPMSLYF